MMRGFVPPKPGEIARRWWAWLIDPFVLWAQGRKR